MVMEKQIADVGDMVFSEVLVIREEDLTMDDREEITMAATMITTANNTNITTVLNITCITTVPELLRPVLRQWSFLNNFSFFRINLLLQIRHNLIRWNRVYFGVNPEFYDEGSDFHFCL